MEINNVLSENVMKVLKVSSDECVMIGDRIDNDIIPANKLNIFSIRF